MVPLGSIVAASRRELLIAGAVGTWIAAALALDTASGIWLQRGIGLLTWLLLWQLARREPGTVRAQIAIVVAVATAVEYTASVGLGLYSYRLGNVPSFVPPGHGLVYLAALALGRSQLFSALRRQLLFATLAVGGAWALWGLVLSGRRDVLGALLYLALLRFCLAGRAPLTYAGAFLVCSYLELVGTRLGTWTWAQHDPSGLLAIGNPPSGIPGGYCFLDAAGMLAAPSLLALLERRKRQAEAREAPVVVLGQLAMAAENHGAAAGVDALGIGHALAVADAR